MNTVHRRIRRNRKGTLLVVVLGLLVALFVIGTSFSYVTLSERRAAANYLDRQRALDLALDGVEYSIARLRSEATQKHYQGITPGTAGATAEREYDPIPYALRPLESAEPAVTWPRNRSKTSTDTVSPDGNWIDFDGDGARGSNETGFGTMLVPANLSAGSKGFASTITGFHADGINNNQVRNADVAFAQNEKYGPSGTYMELGNYFRVRAIDAASMLNLNNFRGPALHDVLIVLGNAIDDWVTGGNPKGEYNPFPAKIAEEMVLLHENLGEYISSKDQIRPLYAAMPKGEELYNLGMMFVTVNSYNDLTYRDWCEANTKVNKNQTANPKQLTDVKVWREGFTASTTQGRDGWPNWMPDTPSCFAKAPVNINTASKPVLVCLFANMQANARMLFYKKQDQITEEDKLMKDKFGATVRRQNSGTTDLGRQNNRTGGVGTSNEAAWYPSGETNQAIFQLVPIGPISSKFGGITGATSSSVSGGVDYASALADAVINLRREAAFTSWQDFDYRFCQRLLLGLPGDRTTMLVPDVVGAARGNLTGQDVGNVFPRDLLPSADNCNHAANPLRSGDAAMSQAAFRAWYWKSAVDMIRSALNPNNVSSRWNPDYPYFQNVDRMDLTRTTSPICFNSMGVFEVTSQGELMARPKGHSDNTTQALDIAQLLPVARRQVRTVVQIYDIMRHQSQQDFVTPVDPTLIRAGATSSSPQSAVTLVAHTRNDTKSFPFSHDELTNGSWEKSPPDFNDAEDARAISYKNGDAGTDKWKGHSKWQMTSTEFGYVSMNPRDRTPIKETRPPLNPVNFWARFNESLRGRTASATFTMFGVNSDNLSADNNWGHLPWERKAVFEDFISTATPRHTESALASQTASEFDTSDDGEQATKYGSLRPDGVLLDGGNLRQRNTKSESSLVFTFDKRGSERMARLKVLRYPCGSQDSGRPFCPIRDVNGASYPNGVDDSRQVGFAPTSAPPNPSTPDTNATLVRLTGQTGPYRGTDEHNRDAQSHRQLRSNMPYYEGTVDFWIKWDLPPQGTDQSGVSGQVANQIVCMGEIDPASHNYSGLFGATAFGRFRDSHNTAYNDPNSDPNSGGDDGRNGNADFEGVQFFVYKEPGGVIRFTRLYFSEAFGGRVDSSATSSGGTQIGRFGSAMRRIFDVISPFGGFTGTNDICNDLSGTPGTTPQANMGFLYARTDAWVDLSQATATGADGNKPIMLRVHDWHRFTLSYNSNSNKPYGLWIDGRVIGPVTFYDDPDGLFGFRNDGAHVGPGGIGRDQPIPTTSTAANAIYTFFRSTVQLLEINPEDRLTVGCIFRRQRDNAGSGLQQAEYDQWYGELDDQADLVKPARPVFKFDSNFVAVANATIDDFRTSRTQLAQLQPVEINELKDNSRYSSKGDPDAYYEGGFLPMNGDDGKLHALPVRLGTISWTEIRPDWDPFAMTGIDLHTSSRLEVQWAVFEDITSMETGGHNHNLTGQKYFGTSGDRVGREISGDDYWALGGMSLKGAVLPSGNTVGVLVYRVYFRVGDKIEVNNVTAILDDVTVTVLTPPRKLSFIVDY
ncbi:MAG: hypothetical protein KF754_10430 [Planctomycetes bacterium]|nr:hypothetical protein [Planctomycetota bacterium]